ncbi:MAG: HlyC/CorC family transporter [Clostridiales bacterium]|nr:HlyC/CorC family transporter [Clostridiales bacterium]
MDLFYILAIFALVILSAFFSAAETAYSSITRVRFKAMAESKSKRQVWAAALGENFEKLITTILIGNNIVNIGAATLATLFFTRVIEDATIAGTVSTIAITLIVLFVGEVAPKTLAKRNPEPIAIFSAPLILFLYYLFYPMNWILGLWQKLLTKIFKKKGDTAITDEVLITYVDEAEDSGEIDAEESELIKSAIEFDDLTVEDALTPRVDIVAVDVTTPVDKVLDIFRETGYSRIPVYKGNIDNIIGILNEKDFYKLYMDGQKKIRNMMSKEVVLVPPSTKISDLLKRLQKGKMHIAIVISEFGGTMGIITLEDILEELVGEIWDEHDEIEEPVKKISDTEYEIAGQYSVDDFFDLFEIDRDPDDYDSVTISGFVGEILDRTPQENDTLSFDNLFIKVLKVEYNRIASIYVKVNKKQEDEELNEGLLLRGLKSSSDEESEE